MARYTTISKLDKIFDGSQYDGRPDWFDGRSSGGKLVPLRERKPCIRYKLGAAATNQVVRFLFGDTRFPKVGVPFDSPETERKEGDLNEEDAKQLDAWLDDLIEAANIEPKTRAFARMGISRKTAVMILEVKDGDVSITLPRPQDCYASFENDDPERAVTKLVWCYEFDKETVGQNGRPQLERHYFRREWDQKNVYVYRDVKKEIGKSVAWGKPETTPHGLTFCPVLWVRNDCEEARGIDGVGLYEGLEDDLEALDMTLSRRHQGVLYLGAPQPWEKGVEPGDGPDSEDDGVGAYSPAGDGPHGVVEGAKRRIAPEYMWSYQGKDVDVQLLETTGKAFEVATRHVDDIRSRALETMGVVLTSMSDTISRVSTGAEMSARFLLLAHAPLVALVHEYRHTWWPYGLRAMLSMLMRMVVDLAASRTPDAPHGQTLNVAGTTEIVPILQRFYVDGKWRCPRLEPKWGQMFEPSATETKTMVDAAEKAIKNSCISRKTAIQRIAPDFGVGDIQAEILAIEEDTEDGNAKELDREARQNAAMHEQMKALGGKSDDSEDSEGAGQGVGARPQRNAGERVAPEGNADGDNASGADESASE